MPPVQQCMRCRLTQGFCWILGFIPTLDGTPPLGKMLSCIVLNLMAFRFCPTLSLSGGRWWHNDSRIEENDGSGAIVELIVE